MIDKLLKMIQDEQGNISLSKLAAATGHLVLAATFIKQQWGHEFNEMQWTIYIGATVFHAGYDKTIDTIRTLKQGLSAGQPSQEKV